MSVENCREKILSPDYLDFILPDYRRDEEVTYPEDQFCVQELGYGYRALYVSRDVVPELSIEAFGYNQIPGCYTLTDMDAVNEAGISAVQNYPTLNLLGKGVLIGFVDTGIDYTHPVFQTAGRRTRIAAIWDQTIQSGAPPEGFAYGSEYTAEMIDEALQADDPYQIVPSRDRDGHGTAVASVAAGGRDLGNRFQGAAPEAEIAVVKLKPAKTYLRDFYAVWEEAVCFQENDIMQGLFYLHRLAQRRQMPLVLCIALGSSFGGHNGTTILARILDQYSNTLDRCVVTGGGNEAGQRKHYRGELREPGNAQEVELRAEQGNSGFVAELWTTVPDVVTAYLVSPSGGRSPSISLQQGSAYTFTFPFEQTTVQIEYRLLLENNDSQLIFFRFENPAEGIWRIGVEPVRTSGGVFDLWLSMRGLIDGDVYFLESSPDDTLTEPGSAQAPMTVACYNGTDNSVDINSGRGYTRNRRIKPDFAAPGVQVMTADTDGRFTRRSGSSIAAGITAGAAALIMEWLLEQPEVTGITTSQVKNIFILGTNQKVLPQYPNREWGYGTLDVYQSLDRLRNL